MTARSSSARRRSPRRDEPASADALVMGEGGGEAALDVDFAAESFHHDSAADQAGDGRAARHERRRRAAMPEDGPDLDAFADDAPQPRRPSARAGGRGAGGRDLFDRAASDRPDRRGRLSDRRRCSTSPTGSASPLARGRARARRRSRRFDPTGVGARDLAECLALQAKEADRYDPCMARLIDNLDSRARRTRRGCKRMCGVDDEDLADMIRELRDYDPKPGCRFGGEPMQAVTPDLFVAQTQGGLGDRAQRRDPAAAAGQPRAIMSSCRRGRRTRRRRRGCRDMLASANWLVKALDQRQRTIIKVATEIVKQQEAFFLHGVAHLQAADAAPGRRRDRDARIDRQPRHLEQISQLRARAVRAQIFLHQRDPVVRRRRRGVGRGGEEPRSAR